MKPRGYIVIALLLLSSNLFAQNLSVQQDSIGRLRKPVLKFLIGEHYRAVSLQNQLTICGQQKTELKYQLDNAYRIIDSYKADSVQADSLINLERAVNRTWKESLSNEKIMHGETKKKVVKWKLLTFASIAVNLTVIYLAVKE